VSAKKTRVSSRDSLQMFCPAAAGQLLRPGFINHDRTIVLLLGETRKSSHGGLHGYCSPWWQLTDATMLDFRVDWEEQ
jgi:hypothetical protein